MTEQADTGGSSDVARCGGHDPAGVPAMKAVWGAGAGDPHGLIARIRGAYIDPPSRDARVLIG